MKQLLVLAVLFIILCVSQANNVEITATGAQQPSTATPTKNSSEDSGETVEVKADYTSSNVTDNKKYVEIKVSKFLSNKYQFQPKVISENKIVFLNAQNLDFYDRELKSPNLTLWLLTGGPEPGKNRSLNYTIKRLFETAWNMNIQLKICDTNKFDLVISSEGLEHIMYDGVQVEKMPDAVLPRLGAKVTYFSLAVVRQLEKMGVLIINEFAALETSKDKLSTMQQLAAHSIPIPKTMIAKFPINTDLVAKELNGYPIILKKSSGSQGKGVMLVQNADHLNDIADMIDPSKSYLIQEFISKSAGRDIRVIVVGGKAIGGMMREAKKGFKSNFHQGGTTRPVKLSTAIEWLAIKSSSFIGLDIAGVDILIDKNTYKICEINSTPGFQGFEMATGIDVAKAMIEFVKFRCGIWKKTKVSQSKSVVTVNVEAEHLTNKPQ